MNDKIMIHGAREHNLKNIDLEIPRDKLIVFVYRCPLQKASAFCSSSWTKASLPSQ